MLSIGWTEMLVIAAVALIVVGPKDLPAMLRNLGRAAGAVRRMGNEFRTELNKVSALDEVRDIRRSITDPLKQSRAEIESEFNKITPTGVQPSGILKPADPKVESVHDQIKARTGAVAATGTGAVAVAPALKTAQMTANAKPVEAAVAAADAAPVAARAPRKQAATKAEAKPKPAAAKTKPKSASAAWKKPAPKADQ